MLTLLLFLLIFSVLVLVHEFGHFIVARKCGIRVREFGIGLPPRAKTLFTDKQGTKYSLNWIPFGGFVKLLGENGEEDGEEEEKFQNQKHVPDSDRGSKIKEDSSIQSDKRTDTTTDYRLQTTDSPSGRFSLHPLYQRIAVVVAGVAMNMLLAVVLLTVVFSTSLLPMAIVPEGTLPFPSYLMQTESQAKDLGILRFTEQPDGIVVNRIEPGSVAEQFGLQANDRIFALDNIRITNGTQLSQLLVERQGHTVTLTINQQGQETLPVDLPVGQPFGIYIDPGTGIVPIRFPPHVALYRAAGEVAKQSVFTIMLLKDVVMRIGTTGSIPDGVSGPVGIFQMTGEVSKGGIIPTVVFAAVLSISLGVMNILPFPGLDGGRFLFLLYEFVYRRRPNQKAEAAIHAAGFAILLLLILAVTWNDIGKIAGG